MMILDKNEEFLRSKTEELRNKNGLLKYFDKIEHEKLFKNDVDNVNNITIASVSDDNLEVKSSKSLDINDYNNNNKGSWEQYCFEKEEAENKNFSNVGCLEEIIKNDDDGDNILKYDHGLQ